MDRVEISYCLFDIIIKDTETLNFSDHSCAYQNVIFTSLISKSRQDGVANCSTITTNMM